MKILVTGVQGQLGHDVFHELADRGHEVIGTAHGQLDITDRQAVEQFFMAIRPNTVVHCAAWTAVDAAEEEENKPKVYAVNADGTRYIAEACRKLDCKMVYISTDYVFDGTGTAPWKPDCTTFAPLNVYGDSKLQGERAVQAALEKYWIVRTSWVFGSHGGNFVKAMLNAGKKWDTVRVVNDQIGTPTYTVHLAKLLAEMCESEAYGCYHAANEGGYISWYDFAREIYRQAGYMTRVVPVTTEEYGLSKAKRPKNSRLDTAKLSENGFARLSAWDNALAAYLKELNE